MTERNYQQSQTLIYNLSSSTYNKLKKSGNKNYDLEFVLNIHSFCFFFFTDMCPYIFIIPKAI